MAIVVLIWSVVLFAAGAGLLWLHRRRVRASDAFGLAKMRQALFLYAAYATFAAALLFGVWGVTGAVDLALRIRAQSFLAGLTLVCAQDWIDVSNPTDREGWVRIRGVQGNGGTIGIDLAPTADPVRVAYPSPSGPFWMGARTTKHVPLKRPTSSPCGPKTGSSMISAGFVLSLFPEEPCDTWSVTLISGLTERRTETGADGGIVVDCPIQSLAPPSATGSP